MSTKQVGDLYGRIVAEISRAVVGKDAIKEALFLALIAGGHVLIEGSPGTAKTKLARSFAESIGGKFKRIQFTPDMMPADITGFYAYSVASEPRFVEGPIFANIVLADELNRTTPRTQSALLEAMQECQVSIERTTCRLESPFIVIATQVLSGGDGTYPLTDVQIDRFMLRVWSEYVTKDEEIEIISRIDQIDEPHIRPVTTLDEILELQNLARTVHVSPAVVDYVVSIVNHLRLDPDVLVGPSTRASIALFKCARVLALLDGRDFVLPDDVKRLASMAIEHRIRVKTEAEMDDVTPAAVLKRALEQTPVPKETQ